MAGRRSRISSAGSGCRGGDERVSWAWSPLWPMEFYAAQLGLLGVVGAGLIVWAVSAAWRDRHVTKRRWRGEALLLWSAAPILIMYGVLALFKPLQGNWAIAGYATLLVLAGERAAWASPTWTGLSWRGSAIGGRGWWHWYLGVGVAAAVVIAAGPWVTRVPGVAGTHAAVLLRERVAGHREQALELDAAIERIRPRLDHHPAIIASDYGTASMLAYYLPGRPRVYCGMHALGRRRSAYDDFPDTDLSDPALRGSDAVLVGADEARWREALRFDSVTPLGKTHDRPRLFLGHGLGHGLGLGHRLGHVERRDDP